MKDEKNTFDVSILEEDLDSAGFVLWLADAEYVSPVGSDIQWHEVPVDLEDDGVGVVGSDGRGSG